jgi:hypothetical protein
MASESDTDTIHRTLAEAQSAACPINERAIEEVVADKDYHNSAVPKDLHQQAVRSIFRNRSRPAEVERQSGRAEVDP